MLRLNCALLAVLIGSALYLVQTQYEARRLYTALHQAQQEARRLEVEFHSLQVEKRAQSSSSRIESKARAQGMQLASPAITHYVRDGAGAH